MTSSPHRRSLFIVSLVGVATLAGCVTPESYETTPVEVESAKGIVTCQLYTEETVLWDRAINRPDSMSVEEADQICITEGARRAAAARS